MAFNDEAIILFGNSNQQVFQCQFQLFDLLAFSACKAAIIAFKTAGSSERFCAAFNMRLTTIAQTYTS